MWISSQGSPDESWIALYFLIKNPACQIAPYSFIFLQTLPMSGYTLGFLPAEISAYFALISSLITSSSIFSCPSPRIALCVTSYMLDLLCTKQISTLPCQGCSPYGNSGKYRHWFGARSSLKPLCDVRNIQRLWHQTLLLYTDWSFFWKSKSSFTHTWGQGQGLLLCLHSSNTIVQN